MLRKWMYGGLLLALLLPGMAQAQQEQAQKDQAPTLVLRIKSFDTLIRDIKILAKAIDQEEIGEQIESMIKGQAGPKGLEGIDTRRPWGVYAKVTPDFSNPGAVAMIPVSDTKAFLKLLENLNFPAKKGEDGVYTIDQQLAPVQIGFRIANNYAYVTADNFDSIKAKNLLRPGEIFTRHDTSDISAALRIDQIPAQFKQLAISKIEEELEKEKQKEEKGETEVQKQFRHQFLDAFAAQIADFLRGGKELAIQFSVNPKTEELVTELLVSGTAKSRLSGNIAALGERQSLFGSLARAKGAMIGLANLRLSDELRKALEPVIAEGMAKALSEQKDARKKQQTEMLLKALEPTLNSGELDGGFSMTAHPGGKGTIVGGLKLKNGAQLEKTVRKLFQELPPGDRAKVKLDVAKVNGTTIHRIDAQEDYDENARRLLGDTPMFLAIRGDAVFFAGGKAGLETLKQALDAEAAVAPALHLEINMKQLEEIGAKSNSEKELARKIFSDTDPGLIRMSVEGGQVLRIRITSGLSVLRFGVALDKMQRDVSADN